MRSLFYRRNCIGIISMLTITGCVLFLLYEFMYVSVAPMKNRAYPPKQLTWNTRDSPNKAMFTDNDRILQKTVTTNDSQSKSNSEVRDPQMDSLTEAPDPSSDMELYLRMSTYRPIFPQMYDSILVQSMKYFWPDNVSMVVVLDKERKPDHDFGDTIQNRFPFPRVYYMELPTTVKFSGFDRMQRDMFYPELCTTKKFVAFIDTDTMFITHIIPKLLFSNGKPIVVGIYGNIWDHFYVLNSMSTENIFKTKEVMRCMSNFPIIFKVDHLIELRKYVEKLHNMTFDEVLFTKMASKFSQFNLMCQYIWMFHREEYEFRLSYQSKKRVTLKSAREDLDYYNKTLTDEQKRPYARVALHYKYIVYANWKHEKTWTYLLKASICYAGGFELCPEKCKKFKSKGIRPEMFIFEFVDWSWDKRCLATQQEHYKQVSAYSSPWYSDILRNACNEVDTLKWTLDL